MKHKVITKNSEEHKNAVNHITNILIKRHKMDPDPAHDLASKIPVAIMDFSEYGEFIHTGSIAQTISLMSVAYTFGDHDGYNRCSKKVTDYLESLT
jgi:hypothetical protein